jgi:hypothetical protein
MKILTLFQKHNKRKKKKKKGKATLEISSLKFQFDLVDNLQSMNV